MKVKLRAFCFNIYYSKTHIFNVKMTKNAIYDELIIMAKCFTVGPIFLFHIYDVQMLKGLRTSALEKTLGN
jgi:hypothetical protein